ncbi:MAG: fibronectin type III domain-containing protein, partial [Chthoniobacterales bacterium]|nr:fibronectin type III domain-containing protein [Chthoniobacterales bacterium]
QSSPARILRYELATKQWLSPIDLPTNLGTPSTFKIDSNFYYITFGNNLYKFNANNLSYTSIYSASHPIIEIIIVGNTIHAISHVSFNTTFAVINKLNDSLLQTYTTNGKYAGFSQHAPDVNKYFAYLQFVSPLDFHAINLSPTGTIVSITDSPYHGEFPIGTKRWVTPNSHLIDSEGIVFHTTTHLYTNGIGGDVQDVIFDSNGHPIILRENKIIRLNQFYLPQGEFTLSQTPLKIFNHNQEVIAFFSSSHPPFGISTQVIPYTSILPPPFIQPPTPPTGVQSPIDAFLGNNNTLYLLTSTPGAIHRWSPDTQQYLQPIPLIESPSVATYSPSLNCIYLAYNDGVIYKIDLNTSPPTHSPFASLHSQVRRLLATGTYLLAIASNSPSIHHVINSSGSFVNLKKSYHCTPLTWCPINKKAYFISEYISPTDLFSQNVNVDTDGSISNIMDSPIHGQHTFTLPIRVAPNGSVVVTGAGKIYQANNLNPLPHQLPNPLADIAWDGNNIRIIRAHSTQQSLFEQYNGQNYNLGLTKVYPGTPYRLFSLPNNKLLGITLMANVDPSFFVMDTHFDILPPPVLSSPQNLTAASITTGILLTWLDISGETEYIIQRKIGPNGTWSQIATTTVNNTSLDDPNVSLGITYHYRVIAKNGNLLSPPSNEVALTHGLPSPPQNLTATPSTGQITLNWTPPTGIFMQHIFRSLTPNGPWNFVQTVNPTATTYTHT